MNKLEVWNILNVQCFWVFLLNFSIHDIDHFYSSTPPKPLRRLPFAPWLMLARLQQWSPYRQIAAIKGLIHAPTPVLPATLPNELVGYNSKTFQLLKRQQSWRADRTRSAPIRISNDLLLKTFKDFLCCSCFWNNSCEGLMFLFYFWRRNLALVVLHRSNFAATEVQFMQFR